MLRLNAFKILFSLAALLFVAKPFIGFGAFNQQTQPRIAHTVLVKSFTKRKPESLQDANAEAEAMHRSLTNPLLVLLSGIVLLLTILFPLLRESATPLTSRALSATRFGILPAEPAYLLTGKLII